MTTKRPDNRPLDDVVGCPNPLCSEVLQFDWRVVPPSQAELDGDRQEFGEALHPVSTECPVVRVAISRTDHSDVRPIEWIVVDGSTVTRTWHSPSGEAERETPA